MAKVVFSDEHDSGEIFNLTVTKEEIFSKIFSDFIETRNGSVMAIFQAWEDSEYEHQHMDFFITKDDELAENYILEYFKHVLDEHINLNIFCFDTYEDCFGYLTDLKEGL
jgi:hypothetical protein